jgi:hypothetical protein
MSSRSEEFWDSFDSLWRRIEFLGRRVKDIEARLEFLESPESMDKAEKEQPADERSN